MKRTRIAALVAAALAVPATGLAAAPRAADAPRAEAAAREMVIEKSGDVLILDDAAAHPRIAANAYKVDADAWKRWADDFSREMRASVGTMFSHRVDARKVVKGAPYSAEVVTEMNQQLPDGNAISRKSSGRVYRDGEGRTRQETAADGRQPSVHISDPVAGKRYIVAKDRRVVEMATPKASDLAQRERDRAQREAERAERTKERGERHASNRQVVRVGGTEIRIEDGKVFIDGNEVPAAERVERRSPSGKSVVVENGRISVDGKELKAPTPPLPPGVVIRQHVTGEGGERREIHVQTIRTGDGREIAIAPVAPVPPVPPLPGFDAPQPPLPPMPPMPGVQTLRFESTAKLGKGVTTQLGVRDFDGLKAEGRSTVWTIPAGEVGNRNPINITSETWYSPELQVTVMSRYHDPRTGESVYRLANIQRAEPSPELFRAPEKAARR